MGRLFPLLLLLLSPLPGPAAPLAPPAGPVELRLSDGSQLRAELRLPPPAAGRGPHPAVMVFGGFENAARVLDLVHPSEPVVLASFDYPFAPPRRFGFPGSLRHAPELKRALHRSIEGVGALARRLASMPEVDPSRITVLGASFGSPLAVLAAADEPLISGVVLVHGFGRLRETAAHQLRRAWEPRYGLAGRAGAWLLAGALELYLGLPSPERSAERLRPGQRVWMLTAEDDRFVPRASSDALWEAIRRSPARSERRLMPGGHLMPGSDRLIADILSLAEGWMREQGLL